jgi:hypothetical protein
MFKKPAKLTAVLTVLLFLGCLSIAVAAYQITSNIVTVNVSAPQATIALVSSATQVVGGTPITLTATLSDQANGVVVTFYDGGTQLTPQVNTSGGGIATLTLTPSVGTHDYTAQASHP